jgi:hypothetical protein
MHKLKLAYRRVYTQNTIFQEKCHVKFLRHVFSPSTINISNFTQCAISLGSCFHESLNQHQKILTFQIKQRTIPTNRIHEHHKTSHVKANLLKLHSQFAQRSSFLSYSKITSFAKTLAESNQNFPKMASPAITNLHKMNRKCQRISQIYLNCAHNN